MSDGRGGAKKPDSHAECDIARHRTGQLGGSLGQIAEFVRVKIAKLDPKGARNRLGEGVLLTAA